MLEPDVTITDYILTIQCLYFARFFAGRSHPWFLLFASISLGSFAGGTVHGFLPDEQSLPYKVLWRVALISIGITAFAGWHVAATRIISIKTVKFIRGTAALQLCLFSVAILFYSQDFVLAALNYLLSALFLLVIFGREYLITGRIASLSGAAAIVLTFVSSYVQISGVSLHPQYFNHNALYHVIQFIALCMLFVAARFDTARQQYAR